MLVYRTIPVNVRTLQNTTILTAEKINIDLYSAIALSSSTAKLCRTNLAKTNAIRHRKKSIAKITQRETISSLMNMKVALVNS